MELNDEIRAKISNAASVDEVVRICAEAGIPVTKEQLEASDTTGAEGELSEEALDAVSGGSVIGLIWLLFRRNGNNRGSVSGGSGGGGGGAW